MLRLVTNLSEREAPLGLYRLHAHADKKIQDERLCRPRQSGATWLVLSVNVGLPRDISWKGRTVHTGIWKDPVPGRCRVRRLNLDGDGEGDLAGHGGEQRAVFVYQFESYRYWQEQLKRTDFVHGQFGENFTVGDRYQIGSSVFDF